MPATVSEMLGKGWMECTGEESWSFGVRWSAGRASAAGGFSRRGLCGGLHTDGDLSVAPLACCPFSASRYGMDYFELWAFLQSVLPWFFGFWLVLLSHIQIRRKRSKCWEGGKRDPSQLFTIFGWFFLLVCFSHTHFDPSGQGLQEEVS